MVLADGNRPQTPEEQQARALFLTAGLGILCSKTLKAYMDHCDRERLTDPGQKGVKQDMTMDQYSQAVKELLGISIWLTLFEQVAAGGVPEWFKEFIVICHAISDKVYATPTAKEIQTKYDLNMPLNEVCQQASINLCLQLDLGGTVNDALIYLGELLERGKQNRIELLTFALTEPLSKLDERIKAG
ncbi:MAG TPA: hypothetical protein V6C72_08155 [Chroococcales cyanobacterium]